MVTYPMINAYATKKQNVMAGVFEFGAFLAFFVAISLLVYEQGNVVLFF